MTTQSLTPEERVKAITESIADLEQLLFPTQRPHRRLQKHVGTLVTGFTTETVGVLGEMRRHRQALGTALNSAEIALSRLKKSVIRYQQILDAKGEQHNESQD